MNVKHVMIKAGPMNSWKVGVEDMLRHEIPTKHHSQVEDISTPLYCSRRQNGFQSQHYRAVDLEVMCREVKNPRTLVARCHLYVTKE